MVLRPLLSWDGFSVRCDLDLLERLANRELPRRVAALREVRIGGDGSSIEIVARLAWQGLPAQLSVELTELRVYRRFLGCRVESVRGPLGLPVPVGVVAAVLRRAVPRLVRLDPADRVLLVDLREWVPPGVELGVTAANVSGRVLELRLAPGSLSPVG